MKKAGKPSLMRSLPFGLRPDDGSRQQQATMKPNPYNLKITSFLLLGFFMLLGSSGDCFGKIFTLGDAAGHGLRGEGIIGNNLHEFDSLHHEGFERGDMEGGFVAVGSGLSQLHAVVEVGHGDLHAEVAEMLALGGSGGPICGSGGNPTAYDNADKAKYGANNGYEGGYKQWVHVILCGIAAGVLGIAVGSLYVALRLGLLSLRGAGFPGKRESVANDAREAAIANAFSETEPMEENSDGWFKVSPYGEFRGKTPGRPQHFTEDAAKRMVSEFNSLRGKLGRMFRGIPIYIGHPDVDPTIWTDDRRLGKATDLQARPDGLWAYGEWNSLGRENQTEGFWVYPSPRWDAPVGQARFEPDRLISIGLTNTPRIETSEPLANSLMNETTDAHRAPLQTETETTLMDPKLIREKLGLAPETTDEEVFAKIESLTNAATDAETRAMDAENAKATAEQTAATEKTAKDEMACSLQTAEANVISFREAADNALLDLAERDGKITKAERAAWQTKLAGDKRDETINSLASIKPKLNTKPLNGGQSREDREQSDNQREQVANAVQELQNKRGLSYVDAWAQVKKDARFTTYFNRSEG